MDNEVDPYRNGSCLMRSSKRAAPRQAALLRRLTALVFVAPLVLALASCSGGGSSDTSGDVGEWEFTPHRGDPDEVRIRTALEEGEGEEDIFANDPFAEDVFLDGTDNSATDETEATEATGGRALVAAKGSPDSFDTSQIQENPQGDVDQLDTTEMFSPEDELMVAQIDQFAPAEGEEVASLEEAEVEEDFDDPFGSDLDFLETIPDSEPVQDPFDSVERDQDIFDNFEQDNVAEVPAAPLFPRVAAPALATAAANTFPTDEELRAAGWIRRSEAAGLASAGGREASVSEGQLYAHLATFSSMSNARSGWNIISGRYGNLLDSMRPVYKPVNIRGRRLVRLFAKPAFSGAIASDDLCLEVRALGEYCVLATY